MITDKLVQIEEDLQYITVASKRNLKDHALIRLILSTLADAEEISNFTKKDLIIKKDIFAVYLRKRGKSRKAPIDKETFKVIFEFSKNYSKKEKIFEYSHEEIDEIIAKYSPKSRKYGIEQLRRGVIKILEDNLLNLNIKDIYSMDLYELANFMFEFHPMFSGMWDLKYDDVAYDYFQMLSKRHGITNFKEISKLCGESVERIEKLMKKKWYQNYMDY